MLILKLKLVVMSQTTMVLGKNDLDLDCEDIWLQITNNNSKTT